MPAKICDMPSDKTVIAESNITNLQQLVEHINDYSKAITEYREDFRFIRQVKGDVLVNVHNTINTKIRKINSDIIKVRSIFNTFTDLCKTNIHFFGTINSKNDCNLYLKEFNCDARLSFYEQIKNKSLSLLNTIQWIKDYPNQKNQNVHDNNLNGNLNQNQEIIVIPNEGNDKIIDEALNELDDLIQKKSNQIKSNSKDLNLDQEKKQILNAVFDELNELYRINQASHKKNSEKSLAQPANTTEPKTVDQVKVTQQPTPTKTRWYHNRRILLASVGLVMFSIIAICAYFKKLPILRTMS
jgi:hypothetical protein